VTLLAVRFPLAQFFGRLALVGAQFGDHRHHAGIDARHQPVGFLALQSRTSTPLAPPGTELTARRPQMATNPGSGITKVNVHSERRDTGQKN
jgi:hypothetical protein